MAMSGSFNVSWESGTWAGVTKWYHWSGNWARSGDTINLTNQKLWMTFAAASWGSGITDSVRVRQTGTSPGYYTVTWTFSSSTSSNVVGLNNVSGSISHTSGSTTFICDISGENSYRLGLSFSTPPLGLSASNIVPGIDNFTANISVSSWGGEGSASNRYRELSVWTASSSGLTSPRRWQASFGNSTSGNITCNNNSSVTSGSGFTIIGNKEYTLGMYATNGTLANGSTRIGNYTTLPPKDTLTLNEATSDTLVINYSTPADGGKYTKTLEYSIDGGTTWVTGATISTGNASTGTFTISGLTANTPYTIQSRVKTTAGTTVNDNLVASTIGPAVPTLSVSNNGSYYDRQLATYGTTTFGGGTDGQVYLYSGTATAPTTIIDSKGTIGSSTYTNSGLEGNKQYFYRARACAIFGSENLIDLTSSDLHTSDGITWVKEGNSYHGTGTLTTYTYSTFNSDKNFTSPLPAGTYILSIEEAVPYGLQISTYDADNNRINYNIPAGSTSKEFAIPNPIVKYHLSLINGTIGDDIDVVYKEVKLRSKDSGKNLFLAPSSWSGRTSDNSVTVTRTSPGTNSTSFLSSTYYLEPNTTYTLSYSKSVSGDTMNRAGQVRLNRDDTWTSTWNSNGTFTFTTGSTGKIILGFYSYMNDNTGGTNTITWSNIQLEKGSSATTFVSHNADYVWSDYSREVALVTRFPRPTINTAAVLEYETVDKVKVRLNTTIPADGGYYASKTVYYRYSTDGGSTFTSWVASEVITDNLQHTVLIDIPNLDVSTTYRFSIRTATDTGGNGSNTYVKDLTTSGRHQPPTNFDYTVSDINTNLQNWLSSFSGYTNPIFVQRQSSIRLTIPEATKGTCSDGTTITEYVGRLVVDDFRVRVRPSTYPETIPFSFNRPLNRTTDYPSNMVTIEGSVYDSLDVYTQVDKSFLCLSWESPTVAVSGERLAQMGTARIDYSGTYARLQDASLNNGNDLNSITVSYRILDAEGGVIKSWTSVTAPSGTIDTNKPFLRNFSGRIQLSDIPVSSDCKVEVRITDHFISVVGSYVLTVWDNAQINEPVHCDIELWDWKTNTYIADLSYLVIEDLNITWELNDVEEVSFSMDLMEFEKKCEEMGLDSEELLKPYAHDIRIRRNGEYILGCQIVDVDVQISNNPPSKISVKGTGFLNLLKDQYILSEAWSGYTYAEIARKLVEKAQLPDCLIKNPTGDIDTSYWLSRHGTIAYNTSAHSGGGCISCGRSGTGWVSGGTQMNVDTGEHIKLDVWVKGQSGIVCYIRECRYITESATQRTITSITLDGTWQHIVVNDYTTFFEDGYILIECNRTNTTNLMIDDCYVYAVNDDASLCNMNIPLGVDTASPTQANNRQVNYELQNVKDALMDLTNMEDDNFEFEFLPDRTFNVYDRKGEDKLDLEVAYPGNVCSMTINRSASNLANKIIAIGSGIGDERLQTIVYSNVSRRSVGTRESVTTDSNISLEETLKSKAIGNLYDRKDPTNIPKIVVKDGSINPSNIETGDVILVEAHGENYIESVTGEYRVVKIAYALSEDAVESMTLTVEPPLERPVKKTIRYIRDSIGGNTVNNGNHWTEIQALMLVGNDYINVAQGKTVTCSNSAGVNLQKATDGSLAQSSGNYAAVPVASSTSNDAITIDLGAEYPIDYIRVWHWYEDGRSYKNDTLSVGTELVGGTTGNAPLEDVLWQYSGQAYVETSQGARSGWLQEESVVEG